ncbi:EAL domain-containing protein [Plastoroseomonas arctica]|uniref:EAL domain-containing protein n=1 Tax=Plastoroseomonas arctica TaxID=1509237 RepID=A0AAF1K4N4_9PROT|nr:EAL domain-containing protein [Plastoroseomonas arctica]MBR0656181.1 EAL domain-containing protein [Plastoroseomonas arctica]
MNAPIAVPTNARPKTLHGCGACRDGSGFAVAFTMAFQPIVDVISRTVWAYEALVRGAAGEGAQTVLDQVGGEAIYAFDQSCRIKAVELAGRLFPPGEATRLSINFLPNAVYEPSACIRATLAAAQRVGFNHRRLMFEFTENERMLDVAHVKRIIAAYRDFGFVTALDDFGAGFAGLALLAELQPDVIKLDMALIRGVEASAPRRAIVAAMVAMTRALAITLIAEGVETEAEVEALRGLGVTLMQGYRFARPGFERLPGITG